MSANLETKTSETPPSNPDEVVIEINGQPIKAVKGMMVIQVADKAGIVIPRFCYHKKLSVAANCRMCLVEVEKAPKPLPACATPVAEGMKVFTQSPVAKMAQRGVMEFLLINHPLDCPICDQGGECDLQDLAVGYGGDISRFSENKRIVKDKNLGPLIATDMTRCIHCTRCVRFGQEVAGIHELGATGRGEHLLIGTYIEKNVNSELSGNVIDLCPVGALTSRPYRYSARPWELIDHDSVSPHDCVGANLKVQTRDGKVMRVLPRENEEVNETWIADRDRFSYEALNSDKRLLLPMVRIDGEWQDTDWDGALEAAVRGLSLVHETHGADQLGALAAPHCTVEEHYLLQKLMRGLGTGNVDHRIRQTDFSDDDSLPPFPWLGQSLQELERLEGVLLVGSNVNKDQPLIGLRLRKAHQRGASIMAINPVDYSFDYKIDHKIIGSPQNMLVALGGVVKALAIRQGKMLDRNVADLLSGIEPGTTERTIADTLLARNNTTVLMGNYASYHAQSAQLRMLCELIAELGDSKTGYLADANSAGAWLAGCVPHRSAAGTSTAKKGLDAYAMLKNPLKGYLTLGLEPELDCLSSGRTRVAMEAADFVVMLTSFKPEPGSVALDRANVLLPMAAFTETAGTLVNCEGRVQQFKGCATPPGETRPAWKILRVLGTLFDVDGFGYDSIEDVRNHIGDLAITPVSRLKEKIIPGQLGGKVTGLTRISDVPIYAVDSIVRHAESLQATTDNPSPAARINTREAQRCGVADGDSVRLRMLEGDAEINLIIDDRVPDGCVWTPVGYPETAALGAHSPVTLSKI